jgi:hypothetical protein
LLGRREFTRDQAYYIKSRLLKKVKVLFGIELPLLKNAGLVDRDLAAGCKIQHDQELTSLVMR